MGVMKSVAGVVVLAAGLTLSGCTQLTDGTAKAGFEPPGGSAASGGSGYKAQNCEQLHSDAWIEVPGTGPTSHGCASRNRRAGSRRPSSPKVP